VIVLALLPLLQAVLAAITGLAPVGDDVKLTRCCRSLVDKALGRLVYLDPLVAHLGRAAYA
jgi:hypothetical protein